VTDQNESFRSKNWLSLAVIGLLVLVIVGVGYLMSAGPKQTEREAALEAAILTAASVAVSALVTKIYAEATYGQSLRDHGVQIASGMMVLKHQIEGLVEWVGQKRANVTSPIRQGYDANGILEHVELTLQGFREMTDAALGGIAGVIGDALAQYEAVMEQIGNLRLEAVKQTTQIQQEISTAISSSEIARLQDQIQNIALRTEREISKLARKSALPIPEVGQKRSATVKCPHCNLEAKFEILDIQGQTQIVVCDGCGGKFNAHIISGHRVIARPLIAGGRTPLQQEAYSSLRRTRAWIPPYKIESLISMAVDHDGRMKSRGEERTVSSLQAAMLSDVAKLSEAGISRGSVRRFFKLAFDGGSFKPPEGQRLSSRTAYVNDLKEQDLLAAYIRTCIHRISQFVPLNSDCARELASLLFKDSSGDIEGQAVQTILDCIRELNATVRPRDNEGGKALDKTA